MRSVTITEARPDWLPGRQLLAELDADLLRHRYPPESRHAFSVEKLLREGVAFFLARYKEDPAGCGGLKIYPGEYGEVKRMYVRPAYRGLGLGKAMLDLSASTLTNVGSIACDLRPGSTRSKPSVCTSDMVSNAGRHLANTRPTR